jgi:hypothetical protein
MQVAADRRVASDDALSSEPVCVSRSPWTRADVVVAALLVVLLVAYFTYTWGVIHAFVIDIGQWHAAALRASQGQVPWRDLLWPSPPLALYVYAAVGAVFGPTLEVFHIISVIVCAFIVVCEFFIYRELVPKPLLSAVVLPTSLIAISQSRVSGEGMAAGMYTPAATIGLLFALLGLLSSIKLLKGHRGWWTLVAGASVCAATATKQDFWLPSAAVALVLLSAVSHRRGSAALLAVLVLLPYAVLLFLAGPRDFVNGLRGFQVDEIFTRPVPSWPFLLDQLAVPIAWIALLLLFGRVTSAHRSTKLVVLAVASAVAAWGVRLALTVWVGVLVQHGEVAPGSDHPVWWLSTAGLLRASLLEHGMSPLSASLRVIGTGLLRNWVSLSCIAALAGVWAVTRLKQPRLGRADAIITFLAIWILLAGARRLFESFEPVQWLMTPALAYLVLVTPYAHVPNRIAALRRTAALVCSVLLLLGIVSFGRFEVFPRLSNEYAWLDTPHGSMYVPKRLVDEVTAVRQLLASIAPAESPVLSGPGDISYALGNVNPTPLLALSYWGFPHPYLERELQQLPDGTWLVIDCSQLHCLDDVATIEQLTRRTWEIVRMPSGSGSPNLLVARPTAHHNE